MNAAVCRLADSTISPSPLSSFALLFVGLALVIIVLAVSAAVLTRMQRAERERRLDAQMEEHRVQREQETLREQAATAVTTTPAPPTGPPDAP